MHHSTHLVLALSLFTACASTPGADPHDASVAQHRATADRHEAAARAHEAQYDPNAKSAEDHCPTDTGSFEVCWTSRVNPTRLHLDVAAAHRKHAADHRAASEALRSAEARACARVSPADRDLSPFAHTEDIVKVERLTVEDLAGDTPSSIERTVGATITFRAVRGMTKEWLQALVDCHLARNAALGHVVPTMPDCPLVLRGVTADVESTGSGFAVRVRADDRAAAAAVVARAERLLAGPAGTH